MSAWLRVCTCPYPHLVIILVLTASIFLFHTPYHKFQLTASISPLVWSFLSDIIILCLRLYFSVLHSPCANPSQWPSKNNLFVFSSQIDLESCNTKRNHCSKNALSITQCGLGRQPIIERKTIYIGFNFVSHFPWLNHHWLRKKLYPHFKHSYGIYFVYVRCISRSITCSIALHFLSHFLLFWGLATFVPTIFYHIAKIKKICTSSILKEMKISIPGIKVTYQPPDLSKKRQSCSIQLPISTKMTSLC